MNQAWKAQLLGNAMFWAKSGLCLWGVSFAVRRLGEFDLPSTVATKLIRVAIVLGCWMAVSLPSERPHPWQGVVAIVGLAAFLWPNLVTRVVNRATARSSEQDGAGAA